MTEHGLNEKHDDADVYLDGAIRAILQEPIPREARSRTIESLAAWHHPERRLAQRNRVRLVVASAAMLFIAAASLYALYARQAPQRNLADSQLRERGAVVPQASKDLHLDERESNGTMAFRAAPKWTSSIQTVVAQHAPVMIANGGNSPIHLGEWIPQRASGGSLHIWDWSLSPISRVVPEVELWSNARVVLSPDGKLLLWARGEVLDLETLKRSPIDLGGEVEQVGEAAYQRIGDMRFSPDGGRIALLIGAKVQIVEFPSGELLCDFPAGEDYALRIAFSADGTQVVSGKRSREVAIYDATTGEELQQFLPALRNQIIATAISADRSHVAAYERTESSDPAEDRDGDLFIWRAASGELAHRIAGAQLREFGGFGPHYGALQFSPDSKYLAAESWGRVFVIDVATGEIAAALKESPVKSIQWSGDSTTITTVAPLSGADGEGELPLGRYDIYPAVNDWNWRDGKKVRSLDAPRLRRGEPAGE